MASRRVLWEVKSAKTVMSEVTQGVSKDSPWLRQQLCWPLCSTWSQGCSTHTPACPSCRAPAWTSPGSMFQGTAQRCASSPWWKAGFQKGSPTAQECRTTGAPHGEHQREKSSSSLTHRSHCSWECHPARCEQAGTAPVAAALCREQHSSPVTPSELLVLYGSQTLQQDLWLHGHTAHSHFCLEAPDALQVPSEPYKWEQPEPAPVFWLLYSGRMQKCLRKLIGKKGDPQHILMHDTHQTLICLGSQMITHYWHRDHPHSVLTT